jgi:hypothetical protein
MFDALVLLPLPDGPAERGVAPATQGALNAGVGNLFSAGMEFVSNRPYLFAGVGHAITKWM